MSGQFYVWYNFVANNLFIGSGAEIVPAQFHMVVQFQGWTGGVELHRVQTHDLLQTSRALWTRAELPSISYVDFQLQDWNLSGDARIFKEIFLSITNVH